jgi:2-keto-3-deoxy-L-rhamnonate aldolase RhmA
MSCPASAFSPNAREVRGQQWVIKHTLETGGVYGLVLPHLHTVEDAQAAVVAARYPPLLGAREWACQCFDW